MFYDCIRCHNVLPGCSFSAANFLLNPDGDLRRSDKSRLKRLIQSFGISRILGPCPIGSGPLCSPFARTDRQRSSRFLPSENTIGSCRNLPAKRMLLIQSTCKKNRAPPTIDKQYITVKFFRGLLPPSPAANNPGIRRGTASRSPCKTQRRS